MTNKGIVLKPLNYIKNSFYIIRLCWSVNKNRVVLEFLRCIVEYIEKIGFGIYFFKIIFDLIYKKANFHTICLYVVNVVIVLLSLTFFMVWYDKYYSPVSSIIISSRLNKMVFRKALEVDLECYENEKFYDIYMFSSEQVNENVLLILNNICKTITSLIASIYVVIYIYTINGKNVLFFILPILGIVYVARKVNTIYYYRYTDSLPFYRKMDYVNRIMTFYNNAMEVKLTNIFMVCKKIYSDAFNDLKKVIRKYAVKSIGNNTLQCILVFVFFSDGLILYNAYLVKYDRLSFYNFIILINAIGSLIWIIIDALSYLGKMSENALCGDKLKTFFNYENKIKDDKDAIEPSRIMSSISLNNVSFTYKGADTPAIKNICIDIKKNEKITIVGENGSGKSTLIKLLLRLYDAQVGQITYNGRNIKEYKIKSYRKLFTTAFQDYQIFAVSLAENILGRTPNNQTDYNIVNEALRKANIDNYVNNLKMKSNTVLTKEFDNNGIELSGGLKQKLALARAFSKDSVIAIFDEPTSALDPIAEHVMFNNILNFCKDKAVILISHRFINLDKFDKIYVMEKGEIVESGTHIELMQLNGKYAKMFYQQAERFNNSGGKL